jgi:DNA polymerase-3 subunit delta
MANYQVIIVKEAQNIKSFEPLLKYVDKPIQSTILCFCYKDKKPDARMKVFKAMADSKDVSFFEAKKVNEAEAEKLVIHLVKEAKRTIQKPAANLLVNLLDCHLERIVQGLKKILINVDPGTEIDDAMVKKHIVSDKTYSIFDLQKALGTKDYPKIAKMQFFFSTNIKDYKFGMATLLHKYFASAYLIGVQPKETGTIINNYFKQEYENVYRNYGKKIPQILEYIEEFDMRCKGIGADAQKDDEHFKEMIYKIILG